MSYQIQISEKQRGFVVSAMQAALKVPEFRTSLSVHPETGEFGDSEKEEYEQLLSMLEQLPEMEIETPGVLHGLCL